eukprot:538244_1
MEQRFISMTQQSSNHQHLHQNVNTNTWFVVQFTDANTNNNNSHIDSKLNTFRYRSNHIHPMVGINNYVPTPTSLPSYKISAMSLPQIKFAPTSIKNVVKSNVNKIINNEPLNHIKPNLNKYKCNKCSKTFKHKTNLKVHSKIHTSEAFVCPFCKKPFARKTNMKQH